MTLQGGAVTLKIKILPLIKVAQPSCTQNYCGLPNLP